MRSNDDLAAEVQALREENFQYAGIVSKHRDELKALKAELDWWRKTFGPEQVAPR